MQSSELIPRPVITTYTIVVPATGIAGVPIAVQIDRNAATTRVEGLISIPAAVAINVIATICIAVVPFILIVIPVGRTKLLISGVHPSSSVHVFLFSGSVAAEEFVAAAKRPIFADFFINGIGFNLVLKKIPTGYMVETRTRLTTIVVKIHTSVGLIYSIP